LNAAPMKFFGIFRGAPPAPAPAAGASAKASATGALFAWNTLSPARWTPRRFDRLADEGFRRNVIAYRCVRVIAQGAATARWLLRGPGGVEFSSHPVLSLLARPNPLAGGAALLENLLGYYLIAGNAYLEAAGPEEQAPRELYALRPDRMKIVPGPAGLPAGYDYTVDGRKLTFPADPLNGRSAILHLKTFNPLDDWYGLSPLEAAAYAIDQHNAASAWNQALLQNAARPSGALVYAPKEGPAALSETQFERLRGEIERHYSGAANAGRPLLLEGGLQWTEMSISPKDMDFIASKLQSARDVCAAYGVPPMLVGVPGDATYANFREARLALWEDTILPLLDYIVDQLNNWLCPRFGDGLRLGVDVDEVSALGPRREAAWGRVQGADFLTVNEKRAAVGYAPIPGGDDLGLQRLPGPPLGRIDMRFDPDQPRVPAGSPDGGQWTDGGGGGGGSGGGSRLDPDKPVSKKPPAWKEKVEGVTKHWDEWNDTVAKLPGITPMKRYVDGEIFAAEGGFDVDKSGAASGISEKVLNDIKAAVRIAPENHQEVLDIAEATKPGDLTMEQRARVYQWFYDKRAMRTVGGGAALGQIEDKYSAAAFADVLFRGGAAGGTEMIQGATNQVLATIPEAERRQLNVPDAIATDRAMGSEVFETYKKLSNAGYGPTLGGNLSDLRRDIWPKEELRNEHFRFRVKP
jgi:HK97 family phage portal protein